MIRRRVEIRRDVAGLDQQPRQRQEIHVGDAVLEPGRDEGRDRQYDRNDLVGDRPAGIGKPDRRAHEHVAQNALEEQRHHVGTDFSGCRIQHGQADAAVIHVEMMRKEDQDNEPERADEVAEPDDGPVAQHRPRRHLSARPRHHDQIVARKQLGAADQDERQSEREHKSADDAHGGEAQRRVAGDDGVVKRTEADAAACHDRQHEGGQKGKVGLLHPDLFDGLLDLGRAVGLQIEDGWLRRGLGPPSCSSLDHRRRYPPAPPVARRPTICTAITFTSVIDGKIMA